LKKTFANILFCVVMFLLPLSVNAGSEESVIVATGLDVPTDYHLEEEYRFPEKYRDDAVLFRTSDGVLLCGWVLGEGTRGVTLGHANGWMTNSWLPFGERLVDAGYMVIIWEFRNILPSGDAAPGQEQRWDLDVLAAAQVLRERGADKILAIGASDGGNATAVAAPGIPELVGLGILSSPARSKGDAVAAVSEINVPAFFAVSDNDPGGKFLPEVQRLYDACASERKEFHILTSYEHGTDLLSDVDVYSRLVGSTEEQKEERRQLANDLMRFVDDAFGVGESATPTLSLAPTPSFTPSLAPTPSPAPSPTPMPTLEPSPVLTPNTANELNDDNDSSEVTEPHDSPQSDAQQFILPLAAGFALIIAVIIILLKKRSRR
jgi:esterase/lipase